MNMSLDRPLCVPSLPPFLRPSPSVRPLLCTYCIAMQAPPRGDPPQLLVPMRTNGVPAAAAAAAAAAADAATKLQLRQMNGAAAERGGGARGGRTVDQSAEGSQRGEACADGPKEGKEGRPAPSPPLVAPSRYSSYSRVLQHRLSL